MKINILLKRFNDTNANGKIIWGERKEAASRYNEKQNGQNVTEGPKQSQQERQCTYNVILRSDRATIVTVGYH